MFADAIEKVDQFTRPIHSVIRHYDGRMVPGSATMFFVNDEGDAVTCRHVVDFILDSERLNTRYTQFRSDRNQLPRDANYQEHLRQLEQQYGYFPDAVIQIKNQFINALDQFKKIKIHRHPVLDLAVIQFREYQAKSYQNYAKFIEDNYEVRQGESLCRLGYPFPEFNNYHYVDQTDQVEFTNYGQALTPRFPIDGIVTRFTMIQGIKAMIEMSTPGLRGQSGGPLFDASGYIYGMQSMTSHLHLGFDMFNKEMMIEGKMMRMTNTPFLHVGLCIHAAEIKKFLRELKIPFHTKNSL